MSIINKNKSLIESYSAMIQKVLMNLHSEEVIPNPLGLPLLNYFRHHLMNYF